jgi:hypothetical protein
MRKATTSTNKQLNLLTRMRPEVSVQAPLNEEERRELVSHLAQLLIEAARSSERKPEEPRDE